MPGTESQKAFDLLEKKFPAASADGATARMVIRAPEGEKIADEKAAIGAVGELGRAPQVAGVADPFAARSISADGRTAYAVVTYKVTAPDLTDKAHDALTAAADRARDGGLTVEAGGDAVAVDAAMSGTGEQIGVLLSAVVPVPHLRFADRRRDAAADRPDRGGCRHRPPSPRSAPRSGCPRRRRRWR